MGVVDIYVAYKFIKLLTIDWKSWDAYKEGVIDKRGHVILDPDKRTRKQKNAYGAFTRLVASVKRIFSKIPFVKSKVGSFAAALWLLKEEAGNRGASELDVMQMIMEAAQDAGINPRDLEAALTESKMLVIPPGKYRVISDVYEVNESIELNKRQDAFTEELGMPLFRIHTSKGEIVVSSDDLERE